MTAALLFVKAEFRMTLSPIEILIFWWNCPRTKTASPPLDPITRSIRTYLIHEY